jgi:hypothetical protein
LQRRSLRLLQTIPRALGTAGMARSRRRKAVVRPAASSLRLEFSHNDYAIANIAVHVPDGEALAWKMRPDVGDDAPMLKLLDDEVTLFVRVNVRRMGDLEAKPGE